MPVYKSSEGVLYNLDKFVSYEVKTDGYQRSGEDSPQWQLLAKTETDREVKIYLVTIVKLKLSVEKN